MARFNKTLFAFPLCLCLLEPAALGREARSYRQLPVINGQVTPDEFEELPYDKTLQKCNALDCRALKSIINSLDFLGHRYFPNTMASIGPPRLPQGPIPILQDISGYPQLGAPSCKLLAVLTKNYFDWSYGLMTIELASLISPGHSECLSGVVSALPRNTETRRLVEYARELCESRQEPNCSAISFK